MGLFDRLKQGLTRTAQQIADRFDELVKGSDAPEQRTRAIEPDTLDGLEEVLLMADVGVAASRSIVEAVARRQRHGESLRQLVRDEILRVLQSAETAGARPVPAGGPRVVLVVGVNGTGKTTTVGKLANQMKQEGLAPLICAADTFRAAAVDQLQVWADRAGVDIVRAREGSDPAAVVFDAMTAGKTRGRDVILVDTAGRLHTRQNLMQELEKIRRVASREIPGAPHETLLVLDGTAGQNGLQQTRAFREHANVTGLVVSKLDGTAKGGVVLSIRDQLRLPVKFVGTGETPEDFAPFDAEAFTAALFGESPAGEG